MGVVEKPRLAKFFKNIFVGFKNRFESATQLSKNNFQEFIIECCMVRDLITYYIQEIKIFKNIYFG
jgi:hypothetical protein